MCVLVALMHGRRCKIVMSFKTEMAFYKSASYYLNYLNLMKHTHVIILINVLNSGDFDQYCQSIKKLYFHD